jgi:uncharacterized protein YkwD
MLLRVKWYTTSIVTVKNKKVPKKTLRAHAKHLLVPHKGNQYHPHLIRSKGIVFIVAFALITQVGYNLMTHGSAVLGRTATTTVSGLLDETNRARTSNGLGALALDPQLDQAAYEKAQDMIKNNYWAHVSPTGVQPWSWITSVGYNYDTAGENLAKNYDSSADTLAAWMASPTHRANVLNTTYTQVGFAVVEGQLSGQQTSLVVAYYAEPAPAGVLGTTTNSPQSFVAPTTGPQNPLTYIGSVVQSLNPATIGSLVLLLVAISVALVTYQYRHKLPKTLQHSWKARHGIYKAAGFAAIAFIILSLTISGGQI